MKLTQIAIIAAALFTTSAAFATEVTVGAGIGQSKLYGAGALNNYGVHTDTKDTAGKVFIGTPVNKYVGVEASYFDLGDFSATGPAGRKASIGARGLGLDAVGTLPITDRLAATGRVGVTRTRLDLDSNVGYGGHKNITEPKAGVGLKYKLTENMDARADYEYYRTNTKAFGQNERSHVNVASVSLAYTFGRPAPTIVKTTYVAPVAAPVVATPAPAPYVAPAPVVEAPVVTTKKVRE